MNPIQGLKGFDPSSDPLGTNLRQRANQTVNGYYDTMNSDPNIDPRMKGENIRQQVSALQSNVGPQGFGTWLQALHEVAPGGISMPGHEKGDPMSGLPTSPLGQTSTIWDPEIQTSSLPPNPAIQGLKR